MNQLKTPQFPTVGKDKVILKVKKAFISHTKKLLKTYLNVGIKIKAISVVIAIFLMY